MTEGTILILVLSIFLQLWLGRFNKDIGHRIGSAAIEAAAADSLNDCVATAVVILSLIVHYFAGVNIDGIAGMLVAGFILHSGWCAARDTLQPLLGQAPKPEYVKELEAAVLSEDKICGVHDLIVHDYGPGRVFVSLHAEIPSTMDIMKAMNSWISWRSCCTANSILRLRSTWIRWLWTIRKSIGCGNWCRQR